MKIVIIGSSGFLGTKSAEIFSKEHEIILAGKSNEGDGRLDASKKEDVRKFLFKHKPDAVLDTVALTSSLQCENNPSLAEKLNYITAKNISEACQEINAWMVFISSTYLFDGKKGDYKENDQTYPINEYARTKIMAENEIIKNPKGIVLRVDIMYGYNGKDKKNGVFDQILSEKPIELREPNQIRQPLYVDDVPRAMVMLIKQNQNGIFHLAGPERVIMIDFLKKLESIKRSDSIISSSKYNSPSLIKIPFNATLNTSKIEALGFKFTSFGEGLEKIKKSLSYS